MPCKCGHDHDWETGICAYPGRCFCDKYEELKTNESVIPQHQRYLEQYKTIEQRVKYLLESVPETRNMPNKDFVFLYYSLFNKLNIINNLTIKELVDPESIRRMKQDLVEQNYNKYGPTDEDTIYEKHLKQNATYQKVMEKYIS